jgi:hypothetical protein
MFFKPLRSQKGGIKPRREPKRMNKGWIAHAQSSRSEQLAGCPVGYPNVPSGISRRSVLVRFSPACHDLISDSLDWIPHQIVGEIMMNEY